MPTALTLRLQSVAQLLRGYVKTGVWGVRVGRSVKMAGSGTFDLRKGSTIRAYTRIFVGPNATFTLMPGAAIGSYSVVNAQERVWIGEGTQISWRCQILDSDFHEIFDENGNSGPVVMPVTIGDRVLVATGAFILKGVTVGDDSVIGAGSVVSSRQAFEQFSLIAGNPAQRRGRIGGWAL